MCRMIAFASSSPENASPYLAHLARLCERGNLVAGWEKHSGGTTRTAGGSPGARGRDPLRPQREAGLGRPAPFGASRADRPVHRARPVRLGPATVHAGNSHPFLAAGIALAHNGTFRGRIGEEADARRVSDSLVFLERLAERWKERTPGGLAEVLREMLSDGPLVGKYSAANLLIAAGDRLFALRRFRRHPEYYTLYAAERNGARIVSSQPLDEGKGWRLLEDGELLDLVSGESISVVSPGAP
jgi:hypothetical protein